MSLREQPVLCVALDESVTDRFTSAKTLLERGFRVSFGGDNSVLRVRTIEDAETARDQ